MLFANYLANQKPQKMYFFTYKVYTNNFFNVSLIHGSIAQLIPSVHVHEYR